MLGLPSTLRNGLNTSGENGGYILLKLLIKNFHQVPRAFLSGERDRRVGENDVSSLPLLLPLGLHHMRPSGF